MVYINLEIIKGIKINAQTQINNKTRINNKH